MSDSCWSSDNDDDEEDGYEGGFRLKVPCERWNRCCDMMQIPRMVSKFREKYTDLGRFRELLQQDVQTSVSWREVTEAAFLCCYASLYCEGMSLVPGFFFSVNQEYKTDRRSLTAMDFRFDQEYLQWSREKVMVEAKVVEREVDDHAPVQDLESLVKQYLQEFQSSSVNSMMADVYEDDMKHYRAFNQRLGEMISIVQQIPERFEIHAPGDGIGVVSISCILLGRRYVSSEPADIGKRALILGIIKMKLDLDQHIEFFKKDDHEDKVFLFSHLSRFVDMFKYSQMVKSVIYDNADDRYRGYRYLDEHKKVQTNIEDMPMLTESYLTSRRDIRGFSDMGLEPMNSGGNEVVSVILSENNCLDEMSQIKAVYDRTKVITGKEFVLTDRKIAETHSSRLNSYEISDGYVRRASNLRTYRLTSTSVERLEGLTTRQEGVRVLSKDYDLKGRLVSHFKLPFKPQHIRFAYSRGYKVPVKVYTMSYDLTDSMWRATIRIDEESQCSKLVKQESSLTSRLY
jgi:hypothetical protein